MPDQLGEAKEAFPRTTPPNTIVNDFNDPSEVALLSDQHERSAMGLKQEAGLSEDVDSVSGVEDEQESNQALATGGIPWPSQVVAFSPG